MTRRTFFPALVAVCCAPFVQRPPDHRLLLAMLAAADGILRALRNPSGAPVRVRHELPTPPTGETVVTVTIIDPRQIA